MKLNEIKVKDKEMYSSLCTEKSDRGLVLYEEEYDCVGKSGTRLQRAYCRLVKNIAS